MLDIAHQVMSPFSYFFTNLRKEGFVSQNRVFHCLFYEFDGSKIIRCFMFREFEMTKKTPKGPFS